jgi:hypothetical protein
MKKKTCKNSFYVLLKQLLAWRCLTEVETCCNKGNSNNTVAFTVFIYLYNTSSLLKNYVKFVLNRLVC